MGALDGREGFWLRLNGPEGGGGCTGRRWGRRPSSVDCGLGELQRFGLRLPEGLGELGGPFYRRPRIRSAAAVDRNGEPLFCSLQCDVSRLGMAAEAS